MFKLVAVRLLALTLLIAMAHVPAVAQVADHERVITVVGTGTVYGESDSAQFEVGVDVASEDLAQAHAEANEIMERLHGVLTAAGVADNDIRTVHYGIWRDDRFDPATEGMAPLFHVMNMVRVTVRDINRLSDLLSQSIEAGANAIGGVQYTISNRRELQRQAREQAVAAAREQAEHFAELTGVELGELLSVTEVLPTDPLAYGGDAAEGLGAGPFVMGGPLAVSVAIQVTFATR
jgi:uncharacterized protein